MEHDYNAEATDSLSNVITWLEQYEQDHDVSIRIIQGSGHQHDPEYLRRSHDGITIVDWGVLGGMAQTRNDRWYVPSSIWTDRSHTTEPVGIYDTLYYRGMHDVDPTYPLISVNDDVILGEYDHHVIALHAALLQLRSYGMVSPEELFADTLNLCMNGGQFEERGEQRLERDRERFLERASQFDESATQNLRSEISEHERMMLDWQRRYQEERRTLGRQQEQLDVMIERRERLANASAEQLLVDWDAVHRHVKVERATWTDNNQLAVYTEELEMVRSDTQQSTAVGRFVLTLNFSTHQVHVRNLTMRRGNRDHPHVADNSFCTGEVGPTINMLMVQGQIAAAVNLAIETLQHANVGDDWGRYAAWWFDNDEEAPDAPEA